MLPGGDSGTEKRALQRVMVTSLIWMVRESFQGNISLELRPGEMRHVKLCGQGMTETQQMRVPNTKQAGHVYRAEDTLVIAVYEVWS